MAQAIKVVGLMRFSVLTPTYYSERFDSLDKIAEHLFSPDRMALRFHIFEQLVLPSLLAQSDPDFELVILTAERLPQEYKDRMQALLADAPHITLRPVGTDKHYQLLKQGYDSVDVGAATHRLMYRLDDDDAVDRDFIRRIKGIATGLRTLHSHDVPTVIACNRGFYVRINEEAENEVFDACERAPLSTGTALLAPVTYPRNPYRYNHRALAQHYNTYSDITVPSFIRTIHGDNKSNPTQMGITRKMRPAVIDEHLHEHFGLSLDQLKAL